MPEKPQLGGAIASHRRNIQHSTSNMSGAAAPLYITIGPPCAGKTTWLKQQQQQPKIVDVCIDDQPGVYLPLPRQWFLSGGSAVDTTTEVTPSLDTRVQGKTIAERLKQETEISRILERLEGRISADDFRSALVKQPQLHSKYVAVNTTLAEVVEELACGNSEKKDLVALPSTVDLFVRESLSAAIPAALQQLRDTPRSTPVAWGNTNSQPSDYQTALEMAHAQGRPVHMATYMEAGELDKVWRDWDNVEPLSMDLFPLQSEGFKDLLRRSIRRLLSTGRYVPARVIWDMRQRSLEWVGRALSAWQPSQSDPRPRLLALDLDQLLVRNAQGKELQWDRTIRLTQQNNNRKRPQFERGSGDRGRPRHGGNHYHQGNRWNQPQRENNRRSHHCQEYYNDGNDRYSSRRGGYSGRREDRHHNGRFNHATHQHERKPPHSRQYNNMYGEDERRGWNTSGRSTARFGARGGRNGGSFGERRFDR